MTDRTYGKTRTCAGCRYWSEEIAKIDAGGQVVALCLSSKSLSAGQYMRPGASCGAWQSGDLGAIDDPDPTVGESYREQAQRDAHRVRA